jgi:outer membrane protein TolC
MKPLIPFAIIATLLGAAADVGAQTAAIRLTLNEAITRGFERNDRLDEMAARVEAARAVASQRGAASAPQVALLASYTRINHIDEFALPGTPGE